MIASIVDHQVGPDVDSISIDAHQELYLATSLVVQHPKSSLGGTKPAHGTAPTSVVVEDPPCGPNRNSGPSSPSRDESRLPSDQNDLYNMVYAVNEAGIPGEQLLVTTSQRTPTEPPCLFKSMSIIQMAPLRLPTKTSQE